MPWWGHTVLTQYECQVHKRNHKLVYSFFRMPTTPFGTNELSLCDKKLSIEGIFLISAIPVINNSLTDSVCS